MTDIVGAMLLMAGGSQGIRPYFSVDHVVKAVLQLLRGGRSEEDIWTQVSPSDKMIKSVQSYMFRWLCIERMFPMIFPFEKHPDSGQSCEEANNLQFYTCFVGCGIERMSSTVFPFGKTVYGASMVLSPSGHQVCRGSTGLKSRSVLQLP